MRKPSHPSAEAVPARWPERLCRFVFPFLQYPILLRHRFMSSRRRVMRGFGTGRGNVVGRILEPGHIRALETRVIGRARGTRGCGQCGLSFVLSLYGSQLGLACGFSFEAGLSVGIDGLFGKVVGAAAGWRGIFLAGDSGGIRQAL